MYAALHHRRKRQNNEMMNVIHDYDACGAVESDAWGELGEEYQTLAWYTYHSSGVVEIVNMQGVEEVEEDLMCYLKAFFELRRRDYGQIHCCSQAAYSIGSTSVY